jgi:iron transport multicopper oxidase
MTLIEDPIALQNTQATIPAGMQAVCKAANIPLKGNAAKNTVDYLNLTGQNMVPEYPKGALYP